MPDLSQLHELGDIGPRIGAVVALVLAILQLPLLSEYWREVTPRRLRWLDRARQLVPPVGDFGAAQVIERELEREVVFRLTRLRLTPGEFAVLAAMNRDHPRQAPWRAVREWANDIVFEDGHPRLTTGRFSRFCSWLSIGYVWLLFSFSVVIAGLAVLIGLLDHDLPAMLKLLAQSVPFGLATVLWARFTQSPYRWQELREVFRRHAQASAAAAAAPAVSEAHVG